MATHFEPPHRLPVRLANGVLGAVHAAGIARKPLDADRLKVWAQRLTGLKDFGNPFFEKPLRLLIDDINDDTDVHDAGRFFHTVFLSSFLQNRLRLVEAWKRNPEILRQEVKPPLVILGLPRTATTRLFNILGGAPDHRTLTFWEASSPVTGRIDSWLPFNARRARSAMTLGTADFLAPNFKSIHELLLDGPEECIHLLANSFASWIFPVEYNSQRYTSWFTSVDHTLPYREFKAQLQLLQMQAPSNRRWLLKSPHHLWGIEALLKVFPDAMIIQTHRDPVKVVPSCCSLAQTTRGIASTSIDPAQLGHQMVDQLAIGLERTRAFRPQIPEGQIIDVHFRDIVADPMGTVARIYDKFGQELDPATEAAIKAELDAEVPAKHGKHGYTLEQFGLSPADIEDKFGDYCEAFGVARES